MVRYTHWTDNEQKSSQRPPKNFRKPADLLLKTTRNSDLLDKKYKEMRWKFNPFFLFIIPIFTFPHNFFFVFLNIIYPLNANEGVVIQSV